MQLATGRNETTRWPAPVFNSLGRRSRSERLRPKALTRIELTRSCPSGSGRAPFSGGRLRPPNPPGGRQCDPAASRLLEGLLTKSDTLFNGGADQDRTGDLLSAIQALSQTELQPHARGRAG